MSLVNLPIPVFRHAAVSCLRHANHPTATRDFQELEKNNPRRQQPLTDPRKSNCGSRLPNISRRRARRRQEPGAPFIKLQAVFLVCVRTVLPSPGEPGAQNGEPEDCRLGLDSEHLCPGQTQTTPHRPKRKKGPRGRGESQVGVRVNPGAVTAGRGLGLSPNIPQPPPPMPRSANGRCLQSVP